MNIIELKDISKSFSGRKVLNQINLSIKKGDIVGLIGRNGSGKTVLMKCICGFLTPEQGRIKLRGKNVDFQKNNIENIGIILETPGFLEQETALNNLWYLANLRNLKKIFYGNATALRNCTSNHGKARYFIVR